MPRRGKKLLWSFWVWMTFDLTGGGGIFFFTRFVLFVWFGCCFISCYFHWKIMCSLCPLLSTGSSPPLSPWRASFSRSERVGVGVAAASSPEFRGAFSLLFSLSSKLPGFIDKSFCFHLKSLTHRNSSIDCVNFEIQMRSKAVIYVNNSLGQLNWYQNWNQSPTILVKALINSKVDNVPIQETIQQLNNLNQSNWIIVDFNFDSYTNSIESLWWNCGLLQISVNILFSRIPTINTFWKESQILLRNS